MTLAIAHMEAERVILDPVRERKPPFSPDDVVKEFATTLKDYGITRVRGDRSGGMWPRERFAVHGVDYQPATQAKSDIYLSLLPIMNSGRVDLLDHLALLHNSALLNEELLVVAVIPSITHLARMTTLSTALLVPSSWPRTEQRNRYHSSHPSSSAGRAQFQAVPFRRRPRGTNGLMGAALGAGVTKGHHAPESIFPVFWITRQKDR
jgi:hypothetical protein